MAFFPINLIIPQERILMISITLDRSEINENQEACESYVEAINTVVNDIFSEPDISLTEGESCVFEGFRLISQKF